jgi:hypothetical protein
MVSSSSMHGNIKNQMVICVGTSYEMMSLKFYFTDKYAYII